MAKIYSVRYGVKDYDQSILGNFYIDVECETESEAKERSKKVVKAFGFKADDLDWLRGVLYKENKKE